MTNTLRLLIAAFLIGLILASCKDPVKHDAQSEVFISSLIEKRIGESGYSISLPVGYSIEEKEGPDFSVFYFSTTDSTAENTFSGGMYFGNYPSFFGPKSDSCLVEEVKSKIMGDMINWRSYNCPESFSIQAIFNSGSDEEWSNKIHAFGSSNKKEGLDRILEVFSTLKNSK